MTPSSDAPPSVPFESSRRCILVVEDEMLIRLIVSEELRDAGYEVVEACDADEALTVLNSLVRIDLIISDVRMPGSMDGLGLLAVVRETSPTLPVIITSGHLGPTWALADGAAQFLAKPYSMEMMVNAVRNELEKAP
jgi:DNA-binding NtrC family response regulator